MALSASRSKRCLLYPVRLIVLDCDFELKRLAISFEFNVSGLRIIKFCRLDLLICARFLGEVSALICANSVLTLTKFSSILANCLLWANS